MVLVASVRIIPNDEMKIKAILQASPDADKTIVEAIQTELLELSENWFFFKKKKTTKQKAKNNVFLKKQNMFHWNKEEQECAHIKKYIFKIQMLKFKFK